MPPAPNSVLVPPPDAERAAQSTRAHVERAVLVLFAVNAVRPEQEPSRNRDSLVQILLRIIEIIVRGIWRATFGNRNVIELTGATEPVDLRVVSRRVAETVLPELEADFIELRRATIDDASPVNAHAAATAFATTAYSSVMVHLIDALPVPVEAKNLMIRKTWVSRLDDKTRPLHRRLDGRTRRYSEPYYRWPTGQMLAYPGDRRAPIDAWIHCRCLQVLHWARDAIEVKKALGRAS